MSLENHQLFTAFQIAAADTVEELFNHINNDNADLIQNLVCAYLFPSEILVNAYQTAIEKGKQKAAEILQLFFGYLLLPPSPYSQISSYTPHQHDLNSHSEFPSMQSYTPPVEAPRPDKTKKRLRKKPRTINSFTPASPASLPSTSALLSATVSTSSSSPSNEEISSSTLVKSDEKIPLFPGYESWTRETIVDPSELYPVPTEEIDLPESAFLSFRPETILEQLFDDRPSAFPSPSTETLEVSTEHIGMAECREEDSNKASTSPDSTETTAELSSSASPSLSPVLSHIEPTTVLDVSVREQTSSPEIETPTDNEMLQTAFEALNEIAQKCQGILKSKKKERIGRMLREWQERYDSFLEKCKSTELVSAPNLKNIESLVKDIQRAIEKKPYTKSQPQKVFLRKNTKKSEIKVAEQKTSHPRPDSSAVQESISTDHQEKLDKLLTSEVGLNLQRESVHTLEKYSVAWEEILYDILDKENELLRPLLTLFADKNKYKALFDQASTIIPSHYSRWISVCSDILQCLLQLTDTEFDEGVEHFQEFISTDFDVLFLMQENIPLPLFDNNIKEDAFFLSFIQLYKKIESRKKATPAQDISCIVHLPDAKETGYTIKLHTFSHLLEALEGQLMNTCTNIEIKKLQLDGILQRMKQFPMRNQKWNNLWESYKNLSAEILQCTRLLILKFAILKHFRIDMHKNILPKLYFNISKSLLITFETYETILKQFLAIDPCVDLHKAIQDKVNDFLPLIHFLLNEFPQTYKKTQELRKRYSSFQTFYNYFVAVASSKPEAPRDFLQPKETAFLGAFFQEQARAPSAQRTEPAKPESQSLDLT